MKPTLRHLRAAVLTLAVMTLASVAGAVTSNTASKPAARPAPAEPGAQSSHLPERFAGQAGRYYRLVWGIDSLEVKTAESGQMIRFSWRVLDPSLARALNDKRAEPALVDQSAGVSLVVPTMEQIGQLRQTAPPEAGKSYWMAFSNKGRLVKPGHRVDVVIGGFRAEGLVVD
jgi:hypothetical protein